MLYKEITIKTDSGELTFMSDELSQIIFNSYTGMFDVYDCDCSEDPVLVMSIAKSYAHDAKTFKTSLDKYKRIVDLENPETGLNNITVNNYWILDYKLKPVCINHGLDITALQESKNLFLTESDARNYAEKLENYHKISVYLERMHDDNEDRDWILAYTGMKQIKMFDVLNGVYYQGSTKYKKDALEEFLKTDRFSLNEKIAFIEFSY